ncbi:MAG TPA: RNA polymerase sigma factor [Gemmatimonadales bacterium]|nr:RNA polymerase sigma factor [Gemmatimonadales bacterium]
MVEPSDGEVVRRVLAGDTDGFAILVARHRERMARFAVHMLGDRDDAEDALQEAFIRAYRSLARCADPDRFDGWLFRIVINRCRTAAGRRARRERAIRDNSLTLVPAPPGPTSGAEWRDAVVRALSRLDGDQREAFLLRHIDGLGYEEMVRLTGVGESALKMRVKRACDRLRVLLGEWRDD